MDYKRKVSSKQAGIAGSDPHYGDLRLLAKSKCLMPIVFAAAMAVIVISIFGFGNVDPGEDIAITVMGIVFILIALLQLSTLTDKVEFYEYGLINYTFLNLKQKRLAYDEIDAIVDIKKRKMFKENTSGQVAIWKIYPKNGKHAIMLDATSYIGISNIMTTVRHDTKIKNIAE